MIHRKPITFWITSGHIAANAMVPGNQIPKTGGSEALFFFVCVVG